MILAHNKATDKKRSARLLAQQIPENVDEWKGEWWIIRTIRFLTEVDPETARIVANKGLGGRHGSITYASCEALKTVGKLEDVPLLDVFLKTRKESLVKDGYESEKDALIVVAVEAKTQIAKRSQSDK